MGSSPSCNGTGAAETLPPPPRKRVAVVGAGSSGMAAAWSLSRFPERFEVDVIEPSQVAGGVACTFRHGDGSPVPVNYGVQGGSPGAHQNTVEMMRTFGVEVADARLDVSFGKGEHNWKNYESKPLQERLRAETRSFGRVLKWISRLEFITIFMSIDFVLRTLRFSEDFCNRMVYPLVALFFGTGNQTPKVSAAIIARVFLDESLAIFDYDPDYLLNQTPTNIAFDDLQAFYGRMRKQMEGQGCTFRMGKKVTGLVRDGDKAQLTVGPAPRSWRGGSDQEGSQYAYPGTARAEAADAAKDIEAAADAARDGGPVGEEDVLEYDEVILACPANVALEILGDTAGFWERRVLSSVEYFADLTVTHTDAEYMRKHNEVDDKAIYFIKTYEEHPDCLEMGFELTAYQPALKPLRAAGHRIFQTIFLDQNRKDLWTIDEIKPSAILDKAWWFAFSHTYKHFRNVVPWVWTIQGSRHTWYAGSWTLFNTHDIAISSGLAAAHRLGAPYPFGHNKLAAATFDTLLGASHLSWRSRQERTAPAE